MRSTIVIIIALVLSAFIYSWLFSHEAYAIEVPEVRGRVVTAGTNAPISGVWVVWRNSGVSWRPADRGNCQNQTAENRYARTDANGYFSFAPAPAEESTRFLPEFDRDIDTNLDGTNDDKQLPRLPAGQYGCVDASGGVHYAYEFSCYSGPQTFTAVLPSGWSGSFSDRSGWVLNNAGGVLDIGTITYTGTISTPRPSRTPSPTITPSPSITPAPSLTPSSVYEPTYPTCNGANILTFRGESSETDAPQHPTRRTINFSANAGTATIKLYTGLGHRWDYACREGPGNDNGFPCDQSGQTAEQVIVKLNGTRLGDTEDGGTDTTRYEEFTGNLVQGNNTLEINHITTETTSLGDGSVFYKGSICAGAVGPTSVPTATPLPTPTTPGCSDTATCSKKEIGEIRVSALGGETFSEKASLDGTEDTWVRLTINGHQSQGGGYTASYPGNDIMMILDSSGSMYSSINTSPTNTADVYKLAAAKEAAKRFIELSEETKDHIGLGFIHYCRRYDTSRIPIIWAYERYSTLVNGDRAIGALSIALQSISGRKNSYYNVLDNFQSFTTSPAAGGYTYCPQQADGQFIEDGRTVYKGTSIGGAITIANTHLTPILSDPQAVRSNGTSYRQSSFSIAGTNNGPRNRGGNVNKNIIIISDGEENADPYINSEEMDKEGRSILQRARDYGVRVYTVFVGSPSGAEQSFMQNIATTTGGRFVYANTQAELIAAIENVRTDITNTSPGLGSPVRVEEAINNTYFEILPPKYGGGDQTFKITRPNSGAEEDITAMATIGCGGTALSCITQTDADNINLNLGTLSPTDTRHIYFRVVPKITSSGSIQVNNDALSKVYYDFTTSPRNYTLDNTSVSISGVANSFFQTFLGNTFSASPQQPSIESLLPIGKYFINREPAGNSSGFAFMNSDEGEFGSGRVNENDQKVINYNVQKNKVDYQSFFDEHKDEIVDISLVTINHLQALSGVKHMIRIDNDLVIEGSEWQNRELSGKQVVVFVPGTLYINTPFTIRADGRSSLAFIVNGNIGVSPTVNRVDGIYLTQGIFDTACNANQFNNNQCGPNTSNVPLRLNGMFSAQNGFRLDRAGVPGISPGEEFHFRPDFILSTSDTLGWKLYSWKEL